MAFQPEAHDIGKLLHLEGTELGKIIKANNHVFVAPDGNPVDFAGHGLTPPIDLDLTWLAAQLHHLPYPGEYRPEAEECKDLSKPSRLSFEARSLIFLMMIADHMGSATSRTISDDVKKGLKRAARQDEKPKPSKNTKRLVKLWNQSKEFEQCGFSTKNDLQKLLDYLAHDMSNTSFLAKFDHHLKNLPEDKFPLMNLTSLYTHCELVGKIYRLLDKHVERLPAKCQVSLEGTSVDTVQQAEQAWFLTLARCKIDSPHQPVRVGDLNVTRLRNEMLDSLSQRPGAGDHILLRTADTLWLMFPGKDRKQITSWLTDCLQHLCKWGFYSESLLFSSAIREIQNIDPAALLKPKAAALRDAGGELKRLLVHDHTENRKKIGDARGRRIRIEKEISSTFTFVTTYDHSVAGQGGREIQPPLCEICQIRPGQEFATVEEGRQVTDYLCDSCLAIRRSGERFRKLAQWGQEQDQVAWVRVILDKQMIGDVVRGLYFGHAEATFNQSPDAVREIKENFRNLGLLSDFVKDYFSFVKRFASKVFEVFGGTRDGSESGYSNIEILDEQYLEFFVLRLDGGETIAKILDSFVETLRSTEDGFPECVHKSPIKLRVSTSRSKYPFYEHWLFLREERGFIRVQIPSKVSLELSFEEYERLVEGGLERKGIARSHLHRLATIEALTHSPLLVRAELAPEARDLRAQRNFKERLLRLDATGALPLSKVLSYARLLDL